MTNRTLHIQTSQIEQLNATVAFDCDQAPQIITVVERSRNQKQSKNIGI